MTNQVHEYVKEIATFAPMGREHQMGTIGTRTQPANSVKQLVKALSSYNERFQDRATATFNKLVKQGCSPSTKQVRCKRLVLSFCAKAGDRPIVIDLFQYMQIGLDRRPTSFPGKLKTGTSPIRVVGERFHDLAVLGLRDAWLKWREAGFDSQA